MLKKTFVPAGIIFLSVLMVLSCATAGAAESTAIETGTAKSMSAGDSSDIQGRDWILQELRINSAVVRIDRPPNTEAFTLRFDAGRVGGIGFPNRYTGPYTAAEGNSLSIGSLISTLMVSLFNIEGLNEHEYFAYLSNAKSWNIQNGKLELTTSGKNGEAVVLVYQ
jgi:heat shock protein HslJ